MLLEVCNLYRRYGEREAVAGLSFGVESGEIFGLLGPNGAGKSSTLGMIAGLIRPDAGSIRVAGIAGERARERIGFVPQALALYPALTACEKLTFWGEIYGLKRHQLQERIRAVLDLVGLSERSQEPVARFSGGMQRRLNLAIGLIHQPQLLLLDEPTVGVDPQSRNRIFEGIEQLNREGLSILYTSHQLGEVEQLCHRVAVLDRGRIIAQGSPAELVARSGQGLVVLGVSAPLEEQLARLVVLPDVLNVQQAPGQVTIATARPQQVLAPVLEVLNKAGLAVQSVQLVEPSLEAVFLQLTGRSLRDEP